MNYMHLYNLQPSRYIIEVQSADDRMEHRYGMYAYLEAESKAL